MAGRTVAQKIWDEHLIRSAEGQPDLLYIDLHLVHEVTSPQAFEGLRLSGRQVRRPDLTLATQDHNVPTDTRIEPYADPLSQQQVESLRANCEEFGVPLYDTLDPRQGIVHIIGPEQGLTQPGLTIVCGDSHTSTHGALGALAFGIGTSEVEHVLATQTLPQAPLKQMSVEVAGELPEGCSAKDVILTILNTIGTGGGVGHVIEYRGDVIRNLSMDGRMTVCNMTIEGGARAGLVAPDQTTIDYVKGRPHAPTDDAWDEAVERWSELVTDEDAVFDKEVVIEGAEIAPFVTWGTNPAQSAPVTGSIPDPASLATASAQESAERALAYQGLTAGTPISDIAIDRVFIGSCTNGRIEDLRAAAAAISGGHVADGVNAMVVPGIRPGEGPGGTRGPGRHIPRRRLRMARRGLLDVPGHEPRHPQPARALRLDQQSKLRRPARPRRPNPPGQPGNGRRRRRRRPLRRRAQPLAPILSARGRVLLLARR